MITKSLFLSIALAAVWLDASLSRSLGQEVGFLSVPISTGYNFIANPFDATDNSLTNVISPSSPPFGTAVYLWNVTNQAFGSASVFSTNGWTANFKVPPGTGFVLNSTSAWTLALTGNVLQGTLTNAYPGGSKFSLLASYFPIDQDLSGPNMTFPTIEGENVYLYYTTNQAYSDAFTYYTGYGWYDPDGIITNKNGPVIHAGQSFFAQNLGADANWVQTFFPPSALQRSQAGSPGSAKPGIQSIHVAGGKATLGILNPGNASYSVQFSTDRSSWQTLAANQTGTIWTGPLPPRPLGYFRVTHQ